MIEGEVFMDPATDLANIWEDNGRNLGADCIGVACQAYIAWLISFSTYQQLWRSISREDTFNMWNYHVNNLNNITSSAVLNSSKYRCTTHVVGPCHHAMARPQVADRGTASFMEGSCE